MKRFLLFCGTIDEPAGGWSDFAGDFASKDEAILEATANRQFAEWWQVIDLEIGREVASSPDGLAGS